MAQISCSMSEYILKTSFARGPTKAFNALPCLQWPGIWWETRGTSPNTRPRTGTHACTHRPPT
eukprot:8853362-Lingulodinium_polyedra.AAC.1